MKQISEQEARMTAAELEAANEIERLRAELEKARDEISQLESICDYAGLVTPSHIRQLSKCLDDPAN